MSTKPRSDAALKTLPESRQADIAEYLRGHSLAETVAWLKEDGCKTSSSSLSEFRSWYFLQETLRENDSTVQSLLADLKSAKPGITPDELDAAGQMFFTALSINQKDSLGWKRAQDVKKNNRLVTALERLLALMEKKAAQADSARGILGDQALTEEQKRQRMLQLFGM